MEPAFESAPAASPWKKHYRGSTSGDGPSPLRVVLPALRALGLVVLFGLVVFGIVKYAVPWVQSWDTGSPSGTPEAIPLAIENVATLSVTDSSAVITWNTSVETTGRVEYGLTAEYGSNTAATEDLSTSHEVTLSGLEPGTTYYYMIESADSAGNTQTAADRTFTTAAPVDGTPPAISQVVCTDISDISAVIEWTTDEAATGLVAYGTSPEYGEIIEVSSQPVTAHSVTITGLEPETSYYFKIISLDAEQNEAAHESVEPFTTAQAIPVDAKEGCRAPDFTLTTYDGANVTLSDYRGQIVLLNFWQLSCGPCRAEMPFLQQAHEDLASSGVVVMAVNPSDNASQIEQYAAENGLTFAIPQDRTRQIAKTYGITTIPRTFFIDTKGVIREIQSGRFKSESDIDKILSSYDW